MSDQKNDSKSQNTGNPGSDRLMDALLGERARVTSGADEDFLARMEKALDTDVNADSKIVAFPMQKIVRISGAIAAALVACLLVLASIGPVKLQKKDLLANVEPNEISEAQKPGQNLSKLEMAQPAKEDADLLASVAPNNVPTKLPQLEEGEAMLSSKGFQQFDESQTAETDTFSDLVAINKSPQRADRDSEAYLRSQISRKKEDNGDAAKFRSKNSLVATIEAAPKVSPTLSAAEGRATSPIGDLFGDQGHDSQPQPGHAQVAPLTAKPMSRSEIAGKSHRQIARGGRADGSVGNGGLVAAAPAPTSAPSPAQPGIGLDGPHQSRDDSFLRKNRVTRGTALFEESAEEAKTRAPAPVEDALVGRRAAPPTDRERYGQLVDNKFLSPLQDPLSTFSVDVDTASYTNVRRMINQAVGIPKDSVRIEEMINYFDYDYPKPDGKHPFAFALETAVCPWNERHQLLRVGIQGQTMDRDDRPEANLVFLIDVSGSMSGGKKLPLVQESLGILVEELGPKDRIAIVVYAGAEGLALPCTKGSDQQTILNAINRLKSGGSTNGGAGIELAYKVAAENFIKDGVNRVILCTDGDFNVGRTGQGDLVEMVEQKAKSGVFLSVCGYGSGNINDSMLEAITNKGNGTYYYVDSFNEARKVFLQDIMSTLVTIAKDVKIQIEFNPAKVQSYRLIGYANRMLKAEDFANDKIDAGEIGAGHKVTALYEIVPTGVEIEAQNPAKPDGKPGLKYQREKTNVEIIESEELATLKLRYKQPAGSTSTLMQEPVLSGKTDWTKASEDFQFSTGVALFGMILRDGEYFGNGTLDDVLKLAKNGKGVDPFDRRKEFLELAGKLHGKNAQPVPR